MLLGTIIVGAVIGILMVYVFDFEQTDDITAARQRGEMVLAILQNPVLHAGLGFPDSVDQFSSLSIKDWGGPVSIVNNVTSSDELRIVYSMPTSIYADSSADLAASTAVSLSDLSLNSITSFPTSDNSFIVDSGDTKGWALFPTANTPLFINSSSLTPVSDGLIAKYDTMHKLRTLEATVNNGVFEIKDDLGSAQPRVDGIEQIYFENNNGILTVYVLARGNKKDSDFATEVVHGWPSDKVHIDDAVKDKGYRLVTVRGSWRIRN